MPARRPALAPAFALILALALALALPAAAAAAFDLGAERIVERGLTPGAEVAFEMPLLVHQDGFLYAKILPTPGNAVHDGSAPNGTWRVAFALLREDGAREELGAFQTSEPTRLAPVAQGERPTLVATVRVPEDAARGGPRQAVYVALAYRADAGGAAPGSASGAQMDEARALTLLLTDALLPPPPPAQGSDGEDVVDVPPVGPVDAGGQDAGAQIVVVPAALPTWFLAGALALGMLAVLLLAALTAIAWLAWRDARHALPHAPRRPARVIPVRTSDHEAQGATQERARERQ